MSEHSGLLYSYVQVQYQGCHDYFNLCTGSPVTRRHLSEVPSDALLVTGSKRVPFLLPPPSSARAWRKPLAVGCKREAVGSAASLLFSSILKQNNIF